jgi:hypothetical protein
VPKRAQAKGQRTKSAALCYFLFFIRRYFPFIVADNFRHPDLPFSGVTRSGARIPTTYPPLARHFRTVLAFPNRFEGAWPQPCRRGPSNTRLEPLKGERIKYF